MTAPHDPGGLRFEKEDVNPGAVAKLAAGLAILTLLVALILVPVFGWLKAREARQDPPAPPLGRQQPGRLPPEPRLQTAPVRDLAAAQAADRALLEKYGWVDERAGVVHIPIERAMEILIAREAQQQAAASATAGHEDEARKELN